MRTYREVFRVPGFTPLFAAVSLQVAAGTIGGLALATLVFTTTRSPLLAALSLFGASFAQVVGAMTVLSVADRVRPRTALVGIALVFAAGAAVLATPGLPVWAVLLVILGTGLVNAASGGVRWGLLSELLPEGGYVLGRSVFNSTVGLMQIAGFGVGGALVTAMSPRSALLLTAVLDVVAAVVLRLGLGDRPPRATGRPSVRRTRRVNRRLWSDPRRRTAYLALWVPNGLVVGCEALFVPYAPGSAGVLFMAAAFGMLTGDVAAGRFLPPGLRSRLITPLRVLLASPYLLFALALPLPVAAVVAAVASVGFGAGLLLQERLLAVTEPEIRGQALGLHSSGMMTMQAVGATVAGMVAEIVSPGVAMAVMAAASLLVTAALTPGLRGLPARSSSPASSAPPPTPTRARR